MFVQGVLYIALGISSIMDIRRRQIPVFVVMAAAGVIVVLLGWQDVLSIRRVVSAICLCGFFVGISKITGEKIGMGDGLLFGLVGLATGFQKCIGIIMLCFGISFVIAIVLLITGKANRNTEIPLAPILLFSAVAIP